MRSPIFNISRFSIERLRGKLPVIAAEFLPMALLFSLIVPCLCQRGPCYNCEEFRLSHPQSHTYKQTCVLARCCYVFSGLLDRKEEKIRGNCTYPCQCSSDRPICSEGVPTVIDGCECCKICAKQKGEHCDQLRICDHSRNLECIYSHPLATFGICKDRSTTCKKYTSEWSECSSICGVGKSRRVSNDNAECETRNETRVCQIRTCESVQEWMHLKTESHRHRKHHTCRATIRSRVPVKLTDEHNCTSVKSFFPNYCGYCPEEKCCTPVVITTKTIAFQCHYGETIERKVMWILKCSCIDGRC